MTRTSSRVSMINGNKLLRDGVLALMFTAMGTVAGRSVHANTVEKIKPQLLHDCSQEIECLDEKVEERDAGFIKLGGLFGALAGGVAIMLVRCYERRQERNTYDPHLLRR